MSAAGKFSLLTEEAQEAESAPGERSSDFRACACSCFALLARPRGLRWQMFAEEAAESGEVPPPRLLYTRAELREMRKLQAAAHAERLEMEMSP